MKIVYSPKFAKAYKDLPSGIQDTAELRELIFRFNPFDARLKTHKLSGKLQDFWAFSINHQYRIIFEFAASDTVYFLFVGSHDIYK